LKCAGHYGAFRVSVALDYRWIAGRLANPVADAVKSLAPGVLSESMTRRRLAIALAIPVALFASLFAQTTKSVWTGVYTTAQATRGSELYQRVCSECHGDDLEGREKSPALAGGPFAQRWDGATLNKLFERMQEMPPGDPGARLQPDQYADILAFLLSASDVPAGSEPLVSDKDMLASIKYTSRPPL
jgi:mono/diheme cytochrome c family protein